MIVYTNYGIVSIEKFMSGIVYKATTVVIFTTVVILLWHT